MAIAEVISIGDELTSGERLDTNGQWLAQRLAECGIQTRFHTTVADDLALNVRVFREACERADIVISTGGLGPTADDLTREALALMAGVPLVVDEVSLAHIRTLFAARQRPMPERNLVQAMFPTGSRAIRNPHGTAPGIAMAVERAGREPCQVYALPGVPAEMREMWTDTLAAEVRQLSGGMIIRHRRIKCFGVGESDLEQMLPDLIRRGRDPTVGFTVSAATITLRVTAAGTSEAECAERMEPTLRIIRASLGSLIFGEEDDELQQAVARVLAQTRVTLGTAEGATAGLIARWMADATFHAHAVKEPVYLGGQLAPPTGDASEGHATARAERARATFAADIGLGVSDLPATGASAESRDQIWIALASATGLRTRPVTTAGHPDILLPRIAKQALNFVMLTLLGVEG